MGNIAVNAIYTPIIYTATFMADGLTVSTQTYTVENKTISMPAVPDKTGYTGAWEYYELTFGDVTVNALYTAKQYTVSLDYDGATIGNEQKTVTVTYDRPIGNLPMPEKRDITLSVGITKVRWLLPTPFGITMRTTPN